MAVLLIVLLSILLPVGAENASAGQNSVYVPKDHSDKNASKRSGSGKARRKTSTSKDDRSEQRKNADKKSQRDS